MRRRLACCLTVLALASAGPVLADACSLENLPAATLLLPYFEVDLNNPGGLTTLVSINNASATATLANVVVWTDLGVPTLSFTVYLTGYDVQTINLRDVFAGTLPRTATAGQDPADTISPRSNYSQDINFASCSGILPLQALPASFVEHLRAAHTGKFSNLLNGCAGQSLGDNRARGYATVDTVNNCTLLNPADPGYFGPSGDATGQNILWGDSIYVDPASNYADGNNLVRIEAFPGMFKPGDLTFYGRYVGNSGADAREPLATTWGSRYVNGGAFSGGTDVVAWRDSGRIVRPFPCGTQPAGFPLQWVRQVTFDEEEQPQVIPLTPVPPGQPPTMPGAVTFPAEANKVHVDSPAFPVPFNFGWLFFDLNSPNPASPGGRDIRQSWMATIMKAQGRYIAGFSATPLDSVCKPIQAEPGQ